MESEGRSPLRILRHALIIAEVFTTVLFLPMKNLPAAKYLQEMGTDPASIGKVGRPWAGALIEKAPPIVSLRLEIQLASSFESRGRWICCVSRKGNPITRTNRLVSRRKRDPAYLEVRRSAGRVAGQALTEAVRART